MKKLILIGLLISNLFATQTIKIYTEQYPPHNMKIAGKLEGRSVEILSAMFKQMNSNQSIKDIKLTNWSRAYSMALKIPNSMVFSTTRTKQRENLFKWVGPIVKVDVGLLALKEKNIKIKNIKDFNNYKIGAVLKDVAEQLLIEKGVSKKNIQHVNGANAINLSFTKMEKGRIDMFAYNTDVAMAGAKIAGYDISKYEIIYILDDTAELYFAFNKQTNDKIIQKWQKALNDIKSNGTYDTIIKKY